MGSYASLAVAGDPDVEVEAAVAGARGWFEVVEAALSPHRADSDLCRWRSGQLALDEASPLVREVLTDVDVLPAVTHGGFHPVDRHGRVDPTGYVKGWAVRRAVEGLLRDGLADVCLGVGGDVQLAGSVQGGQPWRVAVVDPADGRRILAMVEQPTPGAPLAIATSGSTQRGDHIWPGPGPRGPGAQTDLAGVTVVGSDLGLVDAYATAIWALARDRPLAAAWSWLPATGCCALAVQGNGTVRTTPGMAAHIAQPAA